MTLLDAEPHPLQQRRRIPSAALGLAIVVAWTAMFVAVPHLPVSTDIRPFALFFHLASLVLGFGAVLSLDWIGLMWMLGRQDLLFLVRAAKAAHTPIWIGLAGLSLSGVLLNPDTSSPLTVVKLLAVLIVALNGLGASKVQQRLLALDGQTPPIRLLLMSVVVATVSQAGWWTATLVGFLNSQQ